MNTFRLKRRYNPSKRLLWLFRVAFFAAVFAFLALILATLFTPESTYSFQASPIVTALFVLVFVVIAFLIVSGFVLWIGMLYFLLAYDGRSPLTKTFWFVITTFGLQYGAALYYLLIYREFVRRTLSEQEPHAVLDPQR